MEIALRNNTLYRQYSVAIAPATAVLSESTPEVSLSIEPAWWQELANKMSTYGPWISVCRMGQELYT